MKKISIVLVLLFTVLAVRAQFQAGKAYLGASLTGLNMSYNGQDGFNFGVEAKAGYLFEDNWMVLGQAGLNHYGSDAVADNFTAGVGLRYYIIQNGLYLGLNGKFVHDYHSYNDVMPGAEVGYAFFINRSVTIEPAVYYNHSFKNSDYSTVGLKIGLGIYLFDD